MIRACENLQSHILKLFLSGFATGKWFEGFGGIWGSWKDAESHFPRAYLRRTGQSWRHWGWSYLVHGKCYSCLPDFVNKLEHANKGSLNTPTHYLTLNLSVFDVHTCAMALMHTYACTHTNIIQMNVFKKCLQNTISCLCFCAELYNTKQGDSWPFPCLMVDWVIKR